MTSDDKFFFLISSLHLITVTIQQYQQTIPMNTYMHRAVHYSKTR